MIKTSIEHIRDPFLLYDDGVYYVYGTDAEVNWEEGSRWGLYKNTSGALDGAWEKVEKNFYIEPLHAVKNRWAPEVHKYNGSFYMIASYFSSQTGHRGCSILKAAHPEGPFEEITDGHITPKEWDAIDGTLYVDKNGTPWMVFVHEWTCQPDHVGTMAAAKLSEDLTHFASTPVELFRADAAPWAVGNITDGCFMYETEAGALLMLWSNFDKNGYAVGIAKSTTGTVEGPWVQEDITLFDTTVTGMYDGGHGMVFKDTDGKKYLVVHSPNTPNEATAERTLFVPIREEKDLLICCD